MVGKEGAYIALNHTEPKAIETPVLGAQDMANPLMPAPEKIEEKL